MDLTHVSGDESDSGTTASKIAIPGEEYDPSHPLDSSDEDEEPSSCPLTFDTSDTGSNNNNVGVPSVAAATSVGDKVATTTTSVPVPKKGGQPSLLASLSCTSGEALLSSTTNLSAVGETAKTGGTGKEVDIDLSSIPMPSDEYRRPTIQFSIPTRHRLMSISSLIKRQKGVMKKADKDGGSAICYNSEVSKAFNKADGEGEVGEEERPKVSLVQEIFGSDDEDNLKDQEDTTQSPVDQQADGDSNKGDGGGSGPCLSSILLAEGDGGVTSTEHELLGGSNETGDDSSRWKTLEKSSEGGENNEAVSSGGTPPLAGLDSQDEDENSGEEIRISIKPPSELLEAPGNENSSEGEEPEIIVEESAEVGGENDNNSRGKENKQIILECVSDEEPDFEVTFVGIRRPNVGNSRNKPGQSRLSRRNTKDSTPPPRRRSSSPLNGFEEGEIVEMADRKKKKAKKKKSKKRKRSKDSRMSSSKASERSAMDSPEKNKSFSENSDSKEVSWRKPKMAKSRNYRNGKRESPDKHATDRPSRTDDSYRRRSPGRYSSANERLKSRRQRSLSNSRFRSRSRSSSRSSPSRWDGRSRGSRLGQRGESHRSRSSISNHSSPSFSRSRSLTKKRGKRRHSPSPIKRHKNGRSVSKSPPRPSKSPRLSKRHRTNGTEATKRDKVRERSTTPLDTHSLKKTLKPKVDEPLNQETKKKSKKEKTSAEDTDKEKEKRKKRKRKEKSLSPVKAIVADGDSIVVSLSFQKAKEEVPKTPKVTPPAKLESSSVKSKVTNNGNDSECSDDDDSSEKEENTNQPSPKKSTFTINLDLDGSPRERHDSRRSPDVVVLDDNSELSKKSESKKAQEQKADSIKNSSSGSSSQRMDGLDFVSSSHECSVDATQNIFPSPGDPKATPSSAERNSTSKSPYKFSEYFVSSTCGDLGKASSPVVDLSSPRVFSSGKPNDASGTSYSSKNRESSPFSVGDTSRNANSCNNGMDKLSPPSPEPLHSSSSKNSGANTSPTKPMIGNIPGLFPSGFSSSLGGVGSAPPVVIPAPPRIIPNTSTSNLINPNVLVSVASALYAPLLAAKQHGASTSMGQAGGNVISNLQRHGSSANAFFSKSVNSHSQPFGLYNNRTRNGPGEQSGEGGDSPFSPNSSDGDDLFEPPGDGGNNTEGNNSSRKSGEHHQSGSGNPSGSPQFGKYQNDGNRNEKQGLFDTLFSTTPKKSTSHSKHSKKKTSSHMKKSRPKNKSVKDKRPEPEKNGEGTEVTARLNEEVPVSAVALKMKEKYLKKLNRQERVVEEVKLCLKPHYSKKHVNKEEYKEILRKAVPKICHNKSGEINPNKIKELVEAYVKKFRKARKSENSAA